MKELLPNCHFIRNIILRGFCFVYLSAFLSFFVTSKALFGRNGIKPAQVEDIAIDPQNHTETLNSFASDPNLLRVFKLSGVDTCAGIELITLLGALISFLGLVFQSFCILPTFATLWYFYYSLIGVTNIFQQQSDELLLEAGFICLFLAPTICHKKYNVSDNCVLILMRWVLFRFLFTSGAVKLASGCPHWWKLDALQHHFETMPLPTFLAFYSYYLPVNYLKLSTIFVNLCELVCPWLFFAPVRSLRILAFYWSLFLQLNIIATGNYGFLNFLIIIMLLSLLDDGHFRRSSEESSVGLTIRKVFGYILTVATTIAIIVLTTQFYQIRWVDGDLDVSILFNKAEYMELLRQMVKTSPFVAAVTIINVFLQSCLSHPQVTETKKILGKLANIAVCLAMTCCCLTMIGISTVPHGNLHPSTNISESKIGKAYNELHRLHIVNEYGNHLRKMRSERLELTFEYTHSADKEKAEWHELDMLYKPGNNNFSGPFMGPYFDRLDFKLHQSLGAGAKLENNLWLASLTRNLLNKNRDLLRAMSPKNVEKVKLMPKFVRSIFNRLKYVPKSSNLGQSGLFTRQNLSEYLPPLSITSLELSDLLTKANIKSNREKVTFKSLHKFLNATRAYIETIDGHLFVLSVLVAAFLIIIVRRK